jgi:hypothetical protein
MEKAPSQNLSHVALGASAGISEHKPRKKRKYSRRKIEALVTGLPKCSFPSKGSRVLSTVVDEPQRKYAGMQIRIYWKAFAKLQTSFSHS